jgi:hypothetical protein
MFKDSEEMEAYHHSSIFHPHRVLPMLALQVYSGSFDAIHPQPTESPIEAVLAPGGTEKPTEKIALTELVRIPGHPSPHHPSHRPSLTTARRTTALRAPRNGIGCANARVSSAEPAA